MHPRRWVRARLHRRLFVWFGIAIVLTLLSAGLAVRLVRPGWGAEFDGVRRLGASALGRVWHDAAERRRLVDEMERELDVTIELENDVGVLLDAPKGAPCHGGELVLPIEKEGQRLGTARVCRTHGHGGLPFLIALLAGGGVLWGLSGLVARRIARPLSDLSRVAAEIGSGNIKSRIRLGRHAPGEMGQLADAVNDMAVRIERQLEDQRELLAGVSHEIRTPLGRLRVLLELVRDRGAAAEHLDGMEREIREIDELVAELLASSRLDFSAFDRRSLIARDVAAAAIERAGLPRDLLADESDGASVSGDPTLLARALANVIDNAVRYGGGVARVRVLSGPRYVSFSVDDAGPGFAPEFLPRALESFTRSAASERTGTSLGLGLALVRRIAEAHGGKAFAENRESGGARVGFEIPRDRPAAAVD